MPLPQEIRPLNDQLADTLVSADSIEWLESSPGQAWIKVLWTGPESGSWAVLFRWRKGYVAGPHKHLSSAHTFVLKGKMQVRDAILKAGDYIYEPNGMLHGSTTALEDTEYLFICNGPVLFHDGDNFTSYVGWEEFERMRMEGRGAEATSAGAKMI